MSEATRDRLGVIERELKRTILANDVRVEDGKVIITGVPDDWRGDMDAKWTLGYIPARRNVWSDAVFIASRLGKLGYVVSQIDHHDSYDGWDRLSRNRFGLVIVVHFKVELETE